VPSTPQTGLSSRVIALVFSMALVLLGVGAFGALTRHELDRSLADSAKRELERACERAALVLTTSGEAMRADRVEMAAAEAMRQPSISCVRVTDHSGRTLALRLREEPGLAERARTLAVSAPQRPLRKAADVVHAGERLGWSCRTPVWSQGDLSRLLGYVTVAGPDDGAERVSASLPRAATIAGALATLIAAPFAVWAASGLTGPLRRVAGAAEALERGETPEPAPERGPREIRALASSFNRMASSLAEARGRLERSKADLEETVRERTGQLAAVNQALERQIESKNDFLRSVSHDLGAPLRNIAGMASLVLEEHGGALPEEVVRRLERITANVEIESDMLAELLELSKASERAERIESVSVLETARELASGLGHDLEARGITVALGEDLPVLRVDRTDLWMLLQNLIDNAMKYMGQSATRRIEVTALGRDADDDGGPGFAVSDTGPGIPSVEQERVFRAFQRASSAGSEPGKGVGLAVVRSIVERWAGTVEVISDPERGVPGTRFEVRVPSDRVAAAGEVAGKSRPAGAAGPSSRTT